MRVVLGIIVLPLSTMATCKETCAVIIALHKKGFTGKDIAANKIAPKATIYRIIKNFKESGSIVGRRLQGAQASARTVSSSGFSSGTGAPPVQSSLRNGSRQV